MSQSCVIDEWEELEPEEKFGTLESVGFERHVGTNPFHTYAPSGILLTCLDTKEIQVYI